MINDVTSKLTEHWSLIVCFLIGASLLVIGLVIVLAPVEDAVLIPQQINKEGSEAWCDAMLEKPNQAWTETETRLFAKHCLYD